MLIDLLYMKQLLENLIPDQNVYSYFNEVFVIHLTIHIIFTESNDLTLTLTQVINCLIVETMIIFCLYYRLLKIAAFMIYTILDFLFTYRFHQL